MNEKKTASGPDYIPRLTSRFISEALGVHLPGLDSDDAANTFTLATTDSRKIQPGCLFIALKGDKFDGHEFIEKAISQGARGILCRKDFKVQPNPNVRVFPVDDTEAAFRKLGAAWRREFKSPVIAVAGSVGKTTTKELLSAILQGRWPSVLKTQGSQNGFVGIPMTLMDLRPSHGAAVVEVGIDEPGAMEKHMQLVHANYAILTAIGPEHLEKLIDIPTVAREESIALSSVAQTGGTVAINLDDEWIRPLATSLRNRQNGPVGRKVCYTLEARPLPSSAQSVDPEKDFLRGELSSDGRSLKLQGMGVSGLTLKLPLLGKHNAGNLMGAVALACALGLNAEEIQAGLQTFKGADGRSELHELAGDTPVVCDYYNANPSSVEAGLDLLTQIAQKKVRYACLGDMLELGPDELRFHRDLAGKLRALGIENVLLFGPRMRALLEELQKSGFPGQCSHYESHGEMAKDLLKRVKPGDALLIKGSRGMKMEEVWKLFRPDFPKK